MFTEVGAYLQMLARQAVNSLELSQAGILMGVAKYLRDIALFCFQAGILMEDWGHPRHNFMPSPFLNAEV